MVWSVVGGCALEGGNLLAVAVDVLVVGLLANLASVDRSRD